MLKDPKFKINDKVMYMDLKGKIKKIRYGNISGYVYLVRYGLFKRNWAFEDSLELGWSAK